MSVYAMLRLIEKYTVSETRDEKIAIRSYSPIPFQILNTPDAKIEGRENSTAKIVAHK